MRNAITYFIILLIILYVKQADLIRAFAAVVITILFLFYDEYERHNKKRLEQKEQDRRSLEAIAMDFIAMLREKKP